MRLPRPRTRGLIPYSMTHEAQLVMRQLVKHEKRTSVGRALLIISVGALLTLPACGSAMTRTTPLAGSTSDRACPVASCRR
jgi:hypothetical protein